MSSAEQDAFARAQPTRQTSVDDLLGTWRGTSTCVDHIAAPACQDEVIVYEFCRADRPNT